MGSSDSASNLEEWINGCGGDPHRNLPACVAMAMDQAKRDQLPLLRIECRTTQFDGGTSHQEWSNTCNVETTSETQLVEAIRARLVQAPGETFTGVVQVLIKPPSGGGGGNIATYQRRLRPYRPEQIRIQDGGSLELPRNLGQLETDLRLTLEETRANNRLLTDQFARFMSITFDGQANVMGQAAEIMKAGAKILSAHHGPAQQQQQNGKTAFDLMEKAMVLGAANDKGGGKAPPLPPPPPPSSSSNGLSGPAPSMPAGLLTESRPGAASLELEATPAPKQIAADPTPAAALPAPRPITREDVERWAEESPDEAQAMILSALGNRGLTVAPL